MDNGRNLGVTMPPYCLNPLVSEQLVRHMPCNRDKINCKDGTQVLIGSDPERKLADDFRFFFSCIAGRVRDIVGQPLEFG